MEPWTASDDRPPMRAEERSYTGLVVTVAIALIVGLAVTYYWYVSRNFLPPPPLETAAAPEAPPEPVAAAPAADPSAMPVAPEVQPPVSPPVPAPQAAPAKPLPTLEMSDSMMRRALATLIGHDAFASLVIPKELVRRIVATIDNLPREIAPQRMVPLNPVEGRFRVTGSDEEFTLDPANFSRYALYVKVLESVDSRALVRAYAEAYPLFQRAYEELGYPEQQFNDRLLAAIDDMLAAPEPDGPIALMRPRVLYEFADPDLETRSAGQKLLVRMGPANAKRVKAKLREIRTEILSAGRRP